MAESLRRLMSDAPILVDWISADGQILAINDYQSSELQLDRDTILGKSLDVLYSQNSSKLIHGLLAGHQSSSEPFPVWMNTPANGDMPMVAVAVLEEDGSLAVLKLPMNAATLGLSHEFAERIEILSQMIGAATDACWCIEFLEPVDVSLSESEIVERIFSNSSRWRACNDAMARLYDVPDGQDFNTQPVARYFPATPVNKDMIRDLVRSNYRLDAAVAVDQRHDGTEMLVENDFRAAIRDGLLIRLWGTTRDIGAHRRREQQLSDRADSMLDILSAAPDPILVISEDGLLLAANPATERAWGRGIDQILGESFQSLVETRNATIKVLQAAAEDEDGDSECDLSVILANGTRENWRFRIARIDDDHRRYVLTARRKTRRKTGLLAEALT